MLSKPTRSLTRRLGAGLGALALGAAGLAGTATVATPEAKACGGFFCSFEPIEQVGEQIAFGVTEDRVTAVVQIAYQGTAEDFAWVVPVMSVPELEVAPMRLFQELAWRTQPRFNVDWGGLDGECGYGPPMAADAGGFEDRPSEGVDDGVNVVFQEEVGPYDAAVLESTDATKLFEWLDDNGFDQPEASIPLIQHYVDQDMVFVAIKLKKGADVDEIQPLRMDFDANEPCIPLVLTRIAAAPDMPVLAYVLGEARTVPTNWLHVDVNPKKIDWMTGGSNYEEVLTLAIDEASGRAFTTEFAGSSEMLANALYVDGQFDFLSSLATQTDPSLFLDQMFGQFPVDAQIQGLIRKHMPMPAEVPEECMGEGEFYNWNKEFCLTLLEEPFDPAAMVADLTERIVDPLIAGQELFDAFPYLTRLYTTVSPDEMTRDPLFTQNADLPDVSNQHTVQASGTCLDSGLVGDVTLTHEASGLSWSIEGEHYAWGWGWGGEGDFADPAPAEGAATNIRLMGSEGQGELLDRGMAVEVDLDLDDSDPAMVGRDLETGVYGTPQIPQVPTGGGEALVDPGEGCAGGATPFGALPSVLLALGLGLATLRRREDA